MGYRKMKHALAALALAAARSAWGADAAAPEPWAAATFPDEKGYQARIAGALEARAKGAIGERLKSHAKCPKCGNDVVGMNVIGEKVTCEKCGTAFIQPNEGYWGPAARDAAGRITAFKGDPLKHELQTVIARLMVDLNDKEALDYIHIPGVQKQQYHFAAINWVRLYGLLGTKLDEEFRNGLRDHVAVYQEKTHPSNPGQPPAPDNKAHNLVGVKGEMLGGPTRDGGTENHKTQWRTSGLLYAQMFGRDFGKEAPISGVPAEDAEKLITEMIAKYVDTSFRIGNGEYESTTYYPYSFRGFLNLYDFSPKAETRVLAQAALDHYLATYALHMMAFTHTGMQKRGWAGVPAHEDSLDAMCRYWLDGEKGSGVGVPGSDAKGELMPPATVHQVTSGYRPNRVLSRIITKEVALPFEAQMTHPDYHMKTGNQFQEYLYVDKTYAMGSGYMTMVDNPGQQTVWSLTVSGKDGAALTFGGGQPRHRSPEGHSPYTQTMQHKGALILVSADTQAPGGTRDENVETAQRSASAREKLAPRDAPAGGVQKILEWWDGAPGAAESWLFVPRGVRVSMGDVIVIDAVTAWVTVRPLGGAQPYALPPLPEAAGLADAPAKKRLEAMQKAVANQQVLVFPGAVSGYVIEVAEKSAYASEKTLRTALQDRTKLDATKLADENTVAYTTLAGDALAMKYQGAGLRCAGSINGKPLDFAHWAGGAVVESPYVKIKNGVMTVSDGKESYAVEVKGTGAEFRRGE